MARKKSGTKHAGVIPLNKKGEPKVAPRYGPRSSKGSKPSAEAVMDSGGMYWGTRLRKLRLARNLTLEQLADAAGCTKGYLSVIENALREVPSDSMIASLEKALGVPEGELARAADWERTPAHFRREVMLLAAREAAQREREKKLSTLLAASGIDENGKLRGALDEAYRSGELHRLMGSRQDHAPPRQDPASPNTTTAPAPLSRFLAREVPLINSVQAGYPVEFTDLSFPPRVADEYVRCPDIDDADAFAARVVGESMMPEYKEGDIVVFSPARQVKGGMDCFVRLEPDGETTFKRVFFETGGPNGEKTGEERIRLQPLNPAFSATVVDREKVGGLYAAVSVIKKL
ncbi:MAG: helix-turn-helix domain-containing protein [Phycisphaeraceae bacterium]|nr:helix-turn-helix domain-containing protein [Phycisphaeraceae bacterium]